MTVVCTKCGKEITIQEFVPSIFYARCNRCCSMDEGNRNYVYAHLGNTKERAIKVIIRSGYAKRIDDEIQRKECVSKNTDMDTLF